MTMRELVDALARETGWSKQQAQVVVRALFGVPGGILTRTLARREDVRIQGFGVFACRQRPEQQGRNPSTGQPIIIPAATVPTFKAAPRFTHFIQDATAGGGKPPQKGWPVPSPQPARKGSAGSPKAKRTRLRLRRNRPEPPPPPPRDIPRMDPVESAPPEDEPVESSAPDDDQPLDLGPVRSGRRRPPPTSAGAEPDPAPSDAPIPVTLSAEGPRELDVEEESEVRVRLERTDEARPLAHAATARAAPDEPIFVIIRVEGDAVQLVDPPLKQVVPPGRGDPRELAFAIRGRAAGVSRVAIDFQQGSTVLGALTFAVQVVQAGATPEPQAAEAQAGRADPRDDAVLRIIVQPPNGSQPFYTFLVTSKLLDLRLAPFTSPPFELGAGQATDAPLAFAQSMYRRIEDEVLEVVADAALLDRRLKGIGAALCTQLFPEDLIRRLWDGREEIDAIEISSFEPYIPWEVLRLRHPEHGTDERHFGEYRMVRTLSGRRWPADQLGRGDWRYVLGEYPNGMFDPPTGEGAFLRDRLKTLGVTATPILPQPADVLDAMEQGSFDVLHFACHGLSSLEDIDGSALIIGDRRTMEGTTVGVEIRPTDIVDANLAERKPLVFLNACQSGRMAPSLTDLGGWPRAMFNAGAGAFVGTSWSVHEKPAVTFAETFYQALLDGDTLAEAAGDGRAATRGQGASWLAFTVYGLPSARMASAAPSPD